MAPVKMHAGRIPSLDGIRAFSIAAVLTMHLAGTKNFVSYESVDPFNLGFLGVWTFFVISGFLITSLLLEEFDTTGRISLKAFYIRRTLRIFPCSYVFLAVIGIAGLVHAADLWHGYTYTVNYFRNGRSWQVAHLWSLSVEEQFYLLWPAVLCIGGKRRGFQIALAACVVAPFLRLFIWVFFPTYRDYISEAFPTVADALATGCLLAMSRDRLWQQSWYRRLLQSRWITVLPLVAIGCSALYVRPRIFLFAGETAFNIVVAVCIDCAVRFPQTYAGRVLNWKPIAFVGTLSYSLYIWQQIFCVHSQYFGAWWATFPVNIGLTFVAALASYYFVEQPFLALRKRLTRSSRKPVGAGIPARTATAE